MFIDARDLASGEHAGESAFRADVCVVGAGAAGITLALELERAGREVVLLESGGMEFDQGIQDLYHGTASGSVLEPEELYLSRSRVRRFGGSTNHWNGWCRPLDEEDFEPRPWVEHSGWPLSRRELDPYYRRAAPYLDIGGLIEGGPEFFERDPEFESLYFLLSAPTRFGLKYRREIAESTTLRALLYANALEIRATPDHAAVDRIVAATLEGTRLEVMAGHYILACGGVENARILLAVGRQKAGVRVHSPALGRFFMDHPIKRAGRIMVAHGRRSRMLGFDAGERPHQPGGARGVVRPRAQFEADRRWARSIFVFEREGWWQAGDLAQPVARAGITVARLAQIEGRVDGAPYFGAVNAIVEQRPDPASRVTLGTEHDVLGMPRVDLEWRLSAEDERTIGESVEALQRRIGAAFEGRMKNPFIADDPWRGTDGSNHHMGTTRMGDSIQQSVVNPDCRVHGLDNLHLAGSSVFPTCGAVNPTYTIVALAIRLADRLREALE